MNFFSRMTPAARQSALGLIMLGVLLASTAGAWLIVKARSGPRKGESWYLISHTGVAGQSGPIGWRVVQRNQGGPLGLEGYEVSGDPNGVAGCSIWQLDPQATRGRYVSSVPLPPEEGQGDVETRIAFGEGHVTIRQTLIGPRGEVRIPGVSYVAPVDYVPEGRIREVILEVARTGDPFYGRIVLDKASALVELALERQDVETRPGSKTLGLRAVVEMLTVRGASMPIPVRKYYVAGDGTMPLIEVLREQGTDTLTLVPFEQVESKFPTAASQRSMAVSNLEAHGWE
jgi:hypothetical protein